MRLLSLALTRARFDGHRRLVNRPRTIPFGKASAAVCALALASCGPATRTAPRAAAPDPVVAKVDGATITRSDVARLAAGRGVAPDAASPAYLGLIDELVDRKLLADRAVKDGLDRSPDGRRRLDGARERVLSDLILEDRLRGAVSTEAVTGLYQEMERAKPAGAPPETLEQARPRIVRFLTYDRVKDLVLDLRHRAKIEIVPQPAAAGSAKP